MTSQRYFILTPGQRADAMALGNEEAGVGINPRVIDAVGADRAGDYVAPYRMVDDPAVLEHAPELVMYLLMLPDAVLANDAIFAPEPEV
jgi:hypothetical protein